MSLNRFWEAKSPKIPIVQRWAVSKVSSGGRRPDTTVLPPPPLHLTSPDPWPRSPAVGGAGGQQSRPAVYRLQFGRRRDVHDLHSRCARWCAGLKSDLAGLKPQLDTLRTELEKAPKVDQNVTFASLRVQSTRHVHFSRVVVDNVSTSVSELCVVMTEFDAHLFWYFKLILPIRESNVRSMSGFCYLGPSTG